VNHQRGGGSGYLNLDKSHNSLDTKAPRYPNRGEVSVSKQVRIKFVLDSESLKRGLSFQTI